MSDHNNDKTPPRVLVIGAAGLAAGQRLSEAGYDVLIMEARDHVGGRAWTDYDLAAHPVELGAEFIHGDTAVTWSHLRKFGLAATEKVAWELMGIYVDDQLLEGSAFWQQPYAEDALGLAFVDKAAESWRESGQPDASIAEILDRSMLEAGPRQLLRNRILCDYIAPPEDLSIHGWSQETRGHDGEDDFRIIAGYSHLMEKLAEGLDVRLDTPIDRIVWNPSGVVVHSTTGEAFAATQLIITLPLGVLQAGDVTFEPALPAEKQAAITGLGAGMANKLIYKFRDTFWSEEMPALMTTLDSQSWWRPGWSRPNEAPILTAMMGGAAAERFAVLGEGAAIEDGLHCQERNEKSTFSRVKKASD